jgi:hypothetical protein
MTTLPPLERLAAVPARGIELIVERKNGAVAARHLIHCRFSANEPEAAPPAAQGNAPTAAGLAADH